VSFILRDLRCIIQTFRDRLLHISPPKINISLSKAIPIALWPSLVAMTQDPLNETL